MKADWQGRVDTRRPLSHREGCADRACGGYPEPGVYGDGIGQKRHQHGAARRGAHL